jgi:hypothetical protein
MQYRIMRIFHPLFPNIIWSAQFWETAGGLNWDLHSVTAWKNLILNILPLSTTLYVASWTRTSLPIQRTMCTVVLLLICWTFGWNLSSGTSPPQSTYLPRTINHLRLWQQNPKSNAASTKSHHWPQPVSFTISPRLLMLFCHPLGLTCGHFRKGVSTEIWYTFLLKLSSQSWSLPNSTATLAYVSLVFTYFDHKNGITNCSCPILHIIMEQSW